MQTWPHMASVLIFLWCGNGAGPKALISLQAPPKTHPPNMPCPCFAEFTDGCTCFHVRADTIMWVREGSFLYQSTKLILKLNNKLSLNLNRYMYFYVYQHAWETKVCNCKLYVVCPLIMELIFVYGNPKCVQIAVHFIIMFVSSVVFVTEGGVLRPGISFSDLSFPLQALQPLLCACMHVLTFPPLSGLRSPS